MVTIMYLKHISEIEEEDVGDMATKTTIQWLITDKNAGAQNYFMRRFVVKPGGEIFKHSHDWEHEIYCLQGEGIIGVGDKEYKMKKDMFAYVPPNVEHWYRNESNEDWVFLCIIPKTKQ